MLCHNSLANTDLKGKPECPTIARQYDLARGSVIKVGWA